MLTVREIFWVEKALFRGDEGQQIHIVFFKDFPYAVHVFDFAVVALPCRLWRVLPSVHFGTVIVAHALGGVEPASFAGHHVEGIGFLVTAPQILVVESDDRLAEAEVLPQVSLFLFGIIA